MLGSMLIVVHLGHSTLVDLLWRSRISGSRFVVGLLCLPNFSLWRRVYRGLCHPIWIPCPAGGRRRGRPFCFRGREREGDSVGKAMRVVRQARIGVPGHSARCTPPPPFEPRAGSGELPLLATRTSAPSRRGLDWAPQTPPAGSDPA